VILVYFKLVKKTWPFSKQTLEGLLGGDLVLLIWHGLILVDFIENKQKSLECDTYEPYLLLSGNF